MKRWDGENFVTGATLRRWNGTAWVPAPLVADPDAVAFLTAAGISDSTQVGAVNALVIDLKSAGLWTKIQAIYPFVGGTAFAHKWNLKDPRDIDGAFRVTWNSGSAGHSANGFQPGGDASVYGDTHYVPSLHANINDASLFFYSRTNSVGGSQCDFGSYDPVNNLRFHLIIRYDGDLFYYGLAEKGSASSPTPSTDSRGLFANSRLDASFQSGFRNGARFDSALAVASDTLPTQSMYIGRLDDFPPGPSQHEFAMAGMARGLTDLEQAALYTAVQTFQTTLGRQV